LAKIIIISLTAKKKVENLAVAGTAKLLPFTNEQGKTNNNCY
jgi:hypothetical protein